MSLQMGWHVPFDFDPMVPTLVVELAYGTEPAGGLNLQFACFQNSVALERIAIPFYMHSPLSNMRPQDAAHVSVGIRNWNAMGENESFCHHRRHHGFSTHSKPAQELHCVS